MYIQKPQSILIFCGTRLWMIIFIYLFIIIIIIILFGMSKMVKYLRRPKSEYTEAVLGL